MYGLIDEDDGGIIGYFMSEDTAQNVAGTLNVAVERGRDTLPEKSQYDVHSFMDTGNYADLLKSIISSMKECPPPGRMRAIDYLERAVSVLTSSDE